MCLILFAHGCHPEYKLILLANRDEFYQRRALALDYWPDSPSILAGRDVQGNGTWLGVTPGGRLAAITNYRDPANMRLDAPSRGLLISNYLAGGQSPFDYLKSILSKSSVYNGFNLLIGDLNGLYYFSNYTKEIIKVPEGIHGLSNHLLNTPWPKVVHGKELLKSALTPSSRPDIEDLFSLLTDCSVPADCQLPDTGVGIALERILSPLFISSPGYGTRCSSVILLETCGRLQFSERTYSPEKLPPTEIETRTFFIEPDS